MRFNNFTLDELYILRLGAYDSIDDSPKGKIALHLWEEICEAQSNIPTLKGKP